MSSMGSTKRVIRVKRKANEEKSVSNKKCKYIGSCDSSDDKDIYQLLINTKTLTPNLLEDQNQRPLITDYEEFMTNEIDLHLKTISNEQNESLF
jgi:hypothetical protein